MKRYSVMLLCSAGLGALATPAFAQDTSGVSEASDANIIIVQARRRDEDVQDVPAVIDTVTAEEVAKLNIRDFKEVQTLVPGLELNTEANGVGGSAKLRGVNFDINASGFNSTVEFYMNDAPITAGAVLRQMFDVGQIEVQRGPQGTLRGRASPSGAITITTRKPDLYSIGGTVDMTANDIGTMNVKAALNLPVLEGIAAIRVAGVWDENEVDRVRPIDRSYGGHDPFQRTKAGRVSALLTPTDFLKFEGMYQHMDINSRTYDQVASFSEVNPDALPSPVYIATKDRLSIQTLPRPIHTTFDIYNWRAEANLLGQVLIYQGQQYKQNTHSGTSQDPANVFPGQFIYQTTHTQAKQTTHEVRLQNETRVFDMLDYVVGFYDSKNNSPTDLTRPTVIALPNGSIFRIVDTPIGRRGGSHEQSFFGNLTVHIGDATEISGGARHIDYNSDNQLYVGGNLLANDGQDAKKWIYTGSIKHNFSQDFMVYASTGSSWRPGINVVGDFNLAPSALEQSFINLDAETSKSYEIGLKSTWLDGKLKFNLTGYHQKFKNYPYRAPGNGVYFVDTSSTGVNVNQFNFVGAVPVEVNGIEGDLSYAISDRWNIGLVASYSLGKIKNGTIPCNDLNGDGVPDVVSTTPTLPELQAAVGANNLSACQVTQRSAFQSPFSATISSEYNLPISDALNGYLRGLFSYNGSSQVDPTNAYDNVGDYGLLNLFAGVRDPEGMWELSLFAKNVLETEKTLTRTNPVFTSYRQLAGAAAVPVTTTSTYNAVTMTPPREFGINIRYSFGSR